MAPAETVLTLDDLRSWCLPGTHLAVLGHPIKHSISPAMHNAALLEMAKADHLFSSWKYHRFDIPPEQLAEALAWFERKGFRGLNLTVPHKVLACEMIPAIDETARDIGAVNTLLLTAQGWRGFNTDGPGLSQALRETLGCVLAGTDIILLGAGGAARGAAVECLHQHCRALWIGNRTRSNLDGLVAALAALSSGTSVVGFDPQNPPASLPTGAWLINATSAGLKPTDHAPIDLSKFPRPTGVFDMIYNPSETALLKQARELGISRANGLAMLIHQGANALEIWSHASVPVNAMRTGAINALGES